MQIETQDLDSKDYAALGYTIGELQLYRGWFPDNKMRHSVDWGERRLSYVLPEMLHDYVVAHRLSVIKWMGGQIKP